jgi:hypothetical protein
MLLISVFRVLPVLADASFMEEDPEYITDEEFFDHDLNRSKMEEMRNDIEIKRLKP